jgi:hypothetical protein
MPDVKRTRNYFLILAFPALIALPMCSEEPEPISEETYKILLTELALLNQMNEMLLGEVPKEEKREMIFEHYNVTEEEFNRSHDIYQRDIERQMKRIEEVQTILRAERDSLQQAERRYRVSLRESPDTLRQRLLNRD